MWGCVVVDIAIVSYLVIHVSPALLTVQLFLLPVSIVKRMFDVVTIRRLEMMYAVRVDIDVLRMLIFVLVDLRRGPRRRIDVAVCLPVCLLPILLVGSVALSVCRREVCAVSCLQVGSTS